MPTLLLFVVYLFAAMLLAALLFYPVFQLVDAIWQVRPDRIFHRLFMLIALLGFWPFLKFSDLNSRNALGYVLDRKHFLQTFTRGLGIGVMIMAVHAMLLLLLGARIPEPGAILFSELIYTLLTGLLAGILVALIEETFFRGALQYGMRRDSTFITTAICTSLFYASVHFIKPPVTSDSVIIDWNTGWQLLATTFHSYNNFSNIADSFIALFTAGLLLSLIRERTGNIALCIGIHAGWVLTIKMTKEVTNLDPDAATAFLIGSYDNIIGWAATFVLGVVTLWYWRYGKQVNGSGLIK